MPDLLNFLTFSLHQLDSILGSYICLALVFSASCCLKVFFLTSIGLNKPKKIISTPLVFLLLALLGATIQDISWVAYAINRILFGLEASKIVYFIVRVAWGFAVIQNLSLGLFLENLTKHRSGWSIRQKIIVATSLSISAFFFVCAVLFATYNQRIALESTMQKVVGLHDLFFSMLPCLIIAARNLYRDPLPKILVKQLKILLGVVIIPYCLFNLLQIYPFNYSLTWITNSYTFLNFSNILITFAFYYCARKMMGLRFLNFHSHVQAEPIHQFHFVDDFKEVLEQLSKITTTHEVEHVVQNFFKEAFQIPLTKTSLRIRKVHIDGERPLTTELDTLGSLVEGFLNAYDNDAHYSLNDTKIFIYDEIAFSNFYEETEEYAAILQFLEAINVDIFAPVYIKDRLIAYIVVERGSRPNEFYSSIERDQIIVFASYLGNIINLIQNKSLDALIEHDNKLRQELYRKHQEINQYKESIRSFLRTSKQRAIGILFYKNRKFNFGNQIAQELIKINPNQQEGHPLSRVLKQVAHLVETYKSTQTMFGRDSHGNTIVISGVPNLEHNNVIITIAHPEISDILRQQLDALRDPSEWDYLLYLETTQSGKLINQLIPGSGEQLLNFKVELLKIALTKKAILLDMPEADVIPTVELFHHISLRDELHLIDLRSPVKDNSIAISLFGINHLFSGNYQGRPLLERLDGIGTLFIKNVHYLDFETQQALAEFLRTGAFRIFKSDQKISSDVRIICSTQNPLGSLVHAQAFSRELFEELKHTTLSLPSLGSLSKEELSTLAQGFSDQAMQNQTFKSLLELSDKDKIRLIDSRPASLHELKSKVQLMLTHKSKQNRVFHETHFDPAYDVSDPELVEAARLGKYALKDQRIMAMLWRKFKNQNKIATFLGVNRSSVNRRCKEFNLE